MIGKIFLLVVALAAYCEACNQPVVTGKAWTQTTGAALDIGVSANGKVWVVGSDNGVWKQENINGKIIWNKVQGTASRIAGAPDGTACVIGSSNSIWCLQGEGWKQLPGAGMDIGVGSNGAIFVIGTNAVAGGYGIYQYNPSTNSWCNMPGGATRITVDNLGNPWVVNSANAIFYWNGSAWTQTSGAALDIGAGPDGSIWVIGTDQGIYNYICASNTWNHITGAAVQIAVDPAGRPWVVNSGKNIYYWS